MANQLEPAPIQTPLNQRDSLAQPKNENTRGNGSRWVDQDSGLLTLPWVLWIQKLQTLINTGQLPFVTPEQFGAVGDGVADDTIPVQQALDDGRAVMLYANHIYACSSLTFRSNLTIFGLPGSTLLQFPEAGVESTPFCINSDTSGGNYNIYIEGVAFDGNKTNQSELLIDLVNLVNVEDAQFVNCRFVHAVDDCLWGHTLTNVKVKGCYFEDWLEGNVAGAINFGANYGGSIEGITVQENYFNGWTSPATCVNISAQDSALYAKGILVSDNLVYVGNAGIFTETAGVYGSFEGGVPPSGSDTLGIQLFTYDVEAISDAAVTRNVVIGQLNLPPDINGSQPNRCFGISIAAQYGKGITCNSNVVVNCKGPGIEVSEGDTCTGNALYNSNGIHFGAYFRADSENCVISSNVVIEPPISPFYPSIGATGIAVQCGDLDLAGPWSVRNIVISNNLIRRNGDDLTGINIQNQAAGDMANILITGNEVVGFDNTTGYGLKITVDFGAGGTITAPTAIGNQFSHLGNGILDNGSTINGRYMLNRFDDVQIPYPAALPAGTCSLDMDTNGTDLSAPSYHVQGFPYTTLPPEGDIVIPAEFSALWVGKADPTSPSVAWWSGVAYNELQGTYIGVNSRPTNNTNWVQNPTSAYARAMFLGLGSRRFTIRFGAATNTDGAEPGSIAFQVIDQTDMAATQGVYTASGFPIYLEGAAAMKAGSADPEGAVDGSPGSIYLRSSGALYVKVSGVGNTGWKAAVLTSLIARGSGSPEGVVTADPATLYLNTTGAQGEVLWIKESGTGNTGWVSDGGDIWFPTNSPTNTLFRTNKQIGINKAPATGIFLDVADPTNFDSTVKMNALTASRPVKLNASKQFTSALIDVNSANDIAATGFSTNNTPQWDGSKFIPVAGVSVSFTEITSGPTSSAVLADVSLSGVVPPGLTLTKTFINVIDGFGVATHSSTNGIVTS